MNCENVVHSIFCMIATFRDCCVVDMYNYKVCLGLVNYFIVTDCNRINPSACPCRKLVFLRHHKLRIPRLCKDTRKRARRLQTLQRECTPVCNRLARLNYSETLSLGYLLLF